MKVINPEMFRNASRFILGGTGNVLDLQKYFWILWSRNNVFMNSEKYFLVALWKATFLGFPKIS
jgi:hypothetical protein